MLTDFLERRGKEGEREGGRERKEQCCINGPWRTQNDKAIPSRIILLFGFQDKILK